MQRLSHLHTMGYPEVNLKHGWCSKQLFSYQIFCYVVSVWFHAWVIQRSARDFIYRFSKSISPARQFLRKLNIGLPCDQAIPLLDIYPKNWKQIIKDICTFTFIRALFKIAKRQKQTKCPSVDKQISKMWYTYTMEYHSIWKGKEILSHATTWINFEDIMLS